MSNEDTSGGIVAYKNTNTNEIHLTDGVHPDLEARPNMIRVGLEQVPQSVVDAALRAKTERTAIDEAARVRAQGGFTDTPTTGAVVPTAVHHSGDYGTNDNVGVLSKPTLVGNKHQGPTFTAPGSQEVLQTKADADRANPDQRGVLARGTAVDADSAPVTVRDGLVPKPVMATPPTAGNPAVEANREEAERVKAEQEAVEDGDGGETPVVDDPAAGETPDGGGDTPPAKKAAKKAA